VAGPGRGQFDGERQAVEDTLGRLVDKSLVVADLGAGPGRYRLLQTLGEYARERLAGRGEEAPTRARHLRWLHEHAATVEFGADVPDRRAAMVAMLAEDAEVRHALAWAREADPVGALALCERLGFFWCGTLQTRSGWGYLSAALEAAPDAPPALRAQAQIYAGLAGSMCGAPEAAAHGEAAIAHAREEGDGRRLGIACVVRGCSLVMREHPLDALPYLAEAREHFALAADELGLAFTGHWTGYASAVLGDLDAAAAELDVSAARFRRLGDFVGMLSTLVMAADLARRQGRADDAAATYEELIEYGTGGPSTMARAALAQLRLDAGRLDEARELAERAVAESQEGFSPMITALALQARGLVRRADGEPAAAADDLGRAALFFADCGHHETEAECRRAAAEAAAAAVQ